MSTKTTSHQVPVDEPTVVTRAVTPAETPAEAGTDSALTGDEPPFESPEFGVGGFFPHLDASTDG